MFHKHAVPPPSLRSSPSRCALSGSAHLSPVHPGEFCHDRRSAENTHVFLLVRATVSGGPGGRARGVRRRHDLCDCFRSPSPGLNYENGIVTFHSPSNSPATERRGEEGKTSGGRPQGRMNGGAAFNGLLLLSLSGFDSAAPRALQSYRGSGHSFHLPCCSPVEFIALLDSKRMRIGKRGNI